MGFWERKEKQLKCLVSHGSYIRNETKVLQPVNLIIRLASWVPVRGGCETRMDVSRYCVKVRARGREIKNGDGEHMVWHLLDSKMEKLLCDFYADRILMILPACM